ncbi:origin recognition complex subunit 3 [Aricia agestis]|uniref:origin recognition complex subunit 3 n=1 Tax=Aricia agestis TaxID=91739 RepID=UPI001C20977B|nr:origin recognition complex subunit 3 [Aricia agestis]XP_041976431.1 origin recognition complex subunit 3 [Aricia agestis]XP_041976432.1 origin recognition complex subunit 3 [Aricia agestis]
MDPTVSVSKGVFLFPNGFKKGKPKKHSKKNLFESMFTKEPWYVTYNQNWQLIKSQIKALQEQTYSILLNDIVNHVGKFYEENDLSSLEGIIPSATLLTGVNQPDHINQFKALVNRIKENVTSYVALINSQDATTIKHLVENAVWQLINRTQDDVIDDSFDMNTTIKTKVKKSHCTMKTLKKWYEEQEATQSPRKFVKPLQPLVIIMPDFESFNSNILQDFIMILSSYISSLPLLLIFGVATSVSALHKSLPYNVSAKLLIKVFHSPPSHIYMNEVLENIFLTHTSSFHLSGKAFELLTDVFLFYDFSVTGIIQSIKYCMMEHFYGNNIKSLCCQKDDLDEAIVNLSKDDLENIRRLMSFRPFLEAKDCRTKIKLFEDDNYFKEVLFKEINKLHDYTVVFYLCVRLFAAFTKDLPKNILGKTVREIYTKCATESISSTPAFKECMQLIKFQSQMKLIETIKNALKEVNASLQAISPLKPLRLSPMKNKVTEIPKETDLGKDFIENTRVHLLMFLRQIEKARNEATTQISMEKEEVSENIVSSRAKLKEKLLKATKVEKVESEYEMVRSRFVSYLEEVFYKGLQPPHTRPFYEIMFFTDVQNIKKQIVGSPRGALHTALSNPVYYLQCNCCHLPSTDSVSDTLPDVSLAYKLHRECGKHINLYDWLQAFAAVLRPDHDDDDRSEDPVIQARFTRAVSELQFLGFIKSSKRKTDHVMRLTW